jgi:hypothetical protein
LQLKGKDAANNDVEHLLNAGLVPSLMLKDTQPPPFAKDVKDTVSHCDALVHWCTDLCPPPLTRRSAKKEEETLAKFG